MSAQKTDFLKFNAYSIKELITRKLSEDSRYTDQIYEGSNITILIDIISYMYQVLMFQLNNAASESMFSDTQIYENINRLVKMIGYNPKGITPSVADFYFENIDRQYSNIFIPKYSYVKINKTDSNANNIYFSITEKNGFKITDDEVQDIQMVNGRWRLYPTIFTASGSDYEQFETTIGSDINNNKMCASNMVDVYVYDGKKYTQWRKTENELFINNDSNIMNFSTIYQDQEIFSLRLNEQKNYVIKFGNGICGKKMNAGDKIYIFYLETNGIDSQITGDDIEDGVKLECENVFGLNDDIYKQIVLEDVTGITVNDLDDDKKVILYLNNQSTKPKQEETVDEIRENAPNWFKMGQRLVTASDYEYYIKNIADSSVVDCKVQNNFEYCASFYKWLYDLGFNGYNVQSGNRKSDGKYYISEHKFIKYGYNYVDPADSNNVYIWTKMNVGTIESLKQLITNNIQRLKSITQEVVLLSPINVQFAITSAPIEKVKEYIISEQEFDPTTESYLEITLSENSVYSSSLIKNKIENIFIEFFSANKNKLGQYVDYSALLNKIYEIPGVERIRTVYDPGNPQEVIIRNGISFASWSNSYIDVGDDLEVGNSSKKLLEFQFPELNTNDISSRIKVIRKSISNILNVE